MQKSLTGMVGEEIARAKVEKRGHKDIKVEEK